MPHCPNKNVVVSVVVVVVAIVVVVDYVCEQHNNPPDFFLDVLNGSVAVSAAVTTDEKLSLPNGQSFAAPEWAYTVTATNRDGQINDGHKTCP